MKQRLPVIFAIFCFLLFSLSVQAQEATRSNTVAAQCGDIIESVFTENFEEDSYSLDLNPGDSVNASIRPLGQGLNTAMMLTGPTNLVVNVSAVAHQTEIQTEEEPRIITSALAAGGRYLLRAVNFSAYQYGESTDSYFGLRTGGIGNYTVSIGCTLRDGTEIAPGESPEPVVDPTGGIPAPLPFSGFGFPGLAPVDFTNGVTVPLQLGTPMVGSISTNFAGIFGFDLSGSAGDTFDMEFARQSGNLNLGLAVISADNEIVFQVSLVASDSIATRFTLPTDGDYTIGVFQVDLVPPDAPENTAFTLTMNAVE